MQRKHLYCIQIRILSHKDCIQIMIRKKWNDSFVALNAISDSTWIINNVLDGRSVTEKLFLPTNSMLLFKGTMCHAGDGFKEHNFRFHVYLDSKKRTRCRTSNTTYLVISIWIIGLKYVEIKNNSTWCDHLWRILFISTWWKHLCRCLCIGLNILLRKVKNPLKRLEK